MILPKFRHSRGGEAGQVSMILGKRLCTPNMVRRLVGFGTYKNSDAQESFYRIQEVFLCKKCVYLYLKFIALFKWGF